MIAEREILFGLLALKEHCVTRDELIAAVIEWASDRSEPLAETLRRRGAISPDECHLIAPLVDSHLQKHGDDPFSGLPTLSSLSALTIDLQRITPDEVRSVLMSMTDLTAETRRMQLGEAKESRNKTDDQTRFVEQMTFLGTNEDATSVQETFVSSPPGDPDQSELALPTLHMEPEGPEEESEKPGDCTLITNLPGVDDDGATSVEQTIAGSRSGKAEKPGRSGAAPRFIPRYRLGVGGQGEVWLAHDPELDRFVALKIIKPSERVSQDTLARFWREAELTGKLEHPNIVPVYAAESGRGAKGSVPGSPYYAMRVFGNRHLLRAITAFHHRPRPQQDNKLLDALKALHGRRNEANERQLDKALERIDFDDTLECDRQLREAVVAFRSDATDKAGRSLQDTIVAFQESGRPNAEFRELLGRFIDICNAMGYAHSRSVIHRDLKPENVMLGEFGETLVVDWGLAKVIGLGEAHSEASTTESLRLAPDEGSQATMTRVGTVSGTLAYMSPEQASGKVDQMGPASDIYSLGGILYTILAGKPPRSGLPVMQLIELAQSGKIARPSELRSDIPKALEAICLKALSPAPADRYATANDLAADVSRWLADEPVSAWREPFLVRARRWVKQHQTVVGSTVAAVMMAVVTLSALVAVVSTKNSELAGLNRSLDTSNQELTTAGLLLQERLGRLDLERGHRELSDGRIEDGWAYISQASREIPPDSELHSAIANYWSVPQSPLFSVIQVGGEVHAVAFGPDGNSFATGSSDGLVQFWDVATGTKIGEPLVHPGPVRAVAWDLAGGRLITGCDDGGARVWSIDSRQLIGEPWMHTGPVGAVACSRDGRFVVTGCDDDLAQLWDTETGAPIGEPWQHDSPVRAVAFSPDGQSVVTGNLYGAARLWDVASGDAKGTPWQHDGPVNAVAFSPDGLQVVIGSGDGSAHLWDVESGAIVGEPWKHEGPVNAVSFSPDGRYVVAGNFVDSAWLWDVASGTVIGELWKHHRPVGAVAFSSDGRYVVTGSGDGKARLWDIDAATAINEPWQHDGPVRSVAYHPDGRRILSGSTDGVVRLWRVDSSQIIGEPWVHAGPVDAVAFNHDGDLAITGSFDGNARLWDVEAGTVVGLPWLQDGPVNAVSFSPDGTKAVTGSWIGHAQLWDVATGQKIGEPWVHPDWVRCVAFSPDNQFVLTGCGTAVNPEGFAQLWSVETGLAVGDPWKHNGPVLDAVFSPDGRFAMTGSVDGFARLWDVESGTIVGEPWKHAGSVSSVAFSPDGQRLVTVCLNLVQLWDFPTATLIGKLHGREDTVEDVAFSPDGETVVIGLSGADGRSGFVKLWDIARPFHPLLPEGQFGRTLENGQLRNLTDEERGELWHKLNAAHDWRVRYDDYQERRWRSFQLRAAADAESQHAWYAADYHLRALLTAANSASTSESEVVPLDRSDLLLRLGFVNLKLNRPHDVLLSQQQWMELLKQTTTGEPTDADTRDDFVLSHYYSGQAYQAVREYDSAIDSFQVGGDVLRQMIADGMNVEAATEQLEVVEQAADAARTARLALGDWESLMSEPAYELVELLKIRAIEMLKRRELSDAAQAATKLREIAIHDAETLYTVARIYSLCAALSNNTATPPSATGATQQQDWIDAALDTLEQAIAAGWINFEHMQSNRDLQILHGLPKFQELMSTPPPPPLPQSPRTQE